MLASLNDFLSGGAARSALGIPAAAARQIDHAQVYLAGGIGVRAALALLAAGFIWFGLFYLRDGRTPPVWTKACLLFLRLVALGALAAMLLQPTLRIQHSQRQPSTVVLLTDTSQSMGFTDPRLPQERAGQVRRATGRNPAGLTRAETAALAANRSDVDLIAALRKRFTVRQYDFASEATERKLPERAPSLIVAPDARRGVSTQIGGAIRQAAADNAGQRVAGMLILTDGGSNMGEDPVVAADSAKQQGIPVSTLGLGDPTETKDLAITEVLAEQVVRKDNTVQVFAGISHRGFAGKTIQVELRRGGATIQSRSITLGPSSRKQTVAFTFTPRETGAFTYTVATAVLPNEVSAENNRRQFVQRVVSKKLRILYVEGEPRWEYRYLRNAILRDKQIDFSAYLTSSGAQTGGEGTVPIYRFPSDEKSLFEYDILILGDVPRSYFTDLQLRNMRRFVEDKGSSLIIIAGEKHTPQEYRGTPVEDVLPVTLPAVAEPVKSDQAYQWKLTAAGRQDPLLRLSENPEESLRIWRSLPGMFWNAGAERAKPGATVLAVNSARSNAYGKRVVLAVQSFGAGRCLIQLADTTWRWRWRVGDRYFYRYWGQALRAMTPSESPGGNRYAQVNADRAEYLLGDRISIHARLLDSFYRPVKERTVAATLRGETGPPEAISLSAVPGSAGIYSADFTADRVGKFALSVSSPSAPDRRATATFLVQNIALERQQPEMNEALLMKIARAGGGGYYHPDELKRWMLSLKPKDLIVTSETEVELWDAPILLALFVAPLTIEWIARKRLGMA